MVTINSIAVTDNEITELITKLRRWALGSIDWAQFDKYDFQGFNPEMTVASYIACSKKMSLGVDVLEKDIITLVGIGIMKGNITQKNKKRMSDEGIKAYDELVARYGIASSPKGKSSSTITIPRTVAAYAGLAVRMVGKMGPKRYPGKSFRSTELPHFMQITCFPSIVPSTLDSKVKDFLLIGNLCYSMDLTITVKNMKDVKEIESSIDEQRKYVDLAHASTIPSEKSRLGMMTELKVDKYYKQILESVQYYILFKKDYSPPTPLEYSSAIQAIYLPVPAPPVVPTTTTTVIEE